MEIRIKLWLSEWLNFSNIVPFNIISCPLMVSSLIGGLPNVDLRQNQWFETRMEIINMHMNYIYSETKILGTGMHFRSWQRWVIEHE